MDKSTNQFFEKLKIFLGKKWYMRFRNFGIEVANWFGLFVMLLMVIIMLPAIPFIMLAGYIKDRKGDDNGNGHEQSN